MNMMTLTIDGKEVTVHPGKTILDAAKGAGIYIPTLCYHERLLPIGSCRLCVVEVEGYSEPMTACTTPALDGISVKTQSERLSKMRREILNLILTAHPLDCPQCDKGGECRVQDLVHEAGIEKCEYEAIRKDRKDAYATPLIRYWELRCILCGRCFRACREVSGRAAIDIVGKGFEARIAATDSSDCISCGECLSLCPVGALTENLSPVKSRVWQSERSDTTCPHCGFGCRLTLSVNEGRVISKVLSETNLPPNYSSLCARGRFGYDFIDHPARLRAPALMSDGVKKTVGWEEAVKMAADQLKRLDGEGKGLGFIASARATNEELFLLYRIAALFNKARVASAAFHHTGKVAAALAKMGIGFDGGQENLSGCDLIIVAGADLLVNNHLLGNKVRQAVLEKGARVIVIDPLPAALARIADAHLQPMPGQDALVFNALSRRLLKEGTYDKGAETLEGFAELKSALISDADAPSKTPSGSVDSDEAILEKAGRMIGEADRIAVIFGSGITDREESLTALLNFCLLKGLPGRGAIIPTALQANARGAVAILGAGTSPEELLLSDDTAGLLFYEEDPFHFLSGKRVKEALLKKSFVAVCDILPTRVMEFAHLTVPSTGFTEKEGTVISGDGACREVKKACVGRPGGLGFLKDLLSFLGGKRYNSLDELDGDLKKGLSANGGGIPDQAQESASTGRFLAGPSVAAPATAATRPYRLILRDLFASHHLADKDIYAKGIARVQKETLSISPEDAAALGLVDGDAVRLESEDGDVVRPVTVKKGIRQGVLECLLFENRDEILGLSLKPTKVIEVSIRKA